MNLCCTAFGLLLLSAIPASSTIPEATLERALESGCSLVIAEILEVYAKDRMYYYKPRIVRTIIAGDLEKEQTHNPPDLFAGASFGTALKPGSRYAMFIGRDYPYEFAWAFRNDVIKVNPSNKDAVRRLVEVADRIYAGTAIRQFRRTMSWPYAKPLASPAKPPDLPEELASLCKQFREGSGRRTGLGKQIAESDLGSRRDVSDIESSITKYLPPKISLSRQQVLTLLGQPTWRSGWTYSWRCDDFVRAQEGGNEVGILSATFDKNETAVRVLFEMQERSKWIRPARPNDWFAELDGDPGGVARQFLEALRQSDWDRALSLCSQRVKAEALRAAATEVFFRQYVPVEKLAAVSPFRPRGYGSRDGKASEVSAEVEIDVPESKWPLQWRWRLVRAGSSWLADFELVPLDRFIQKEIIQREFLPDGARRGEMSERDLTYILTPITGEFVIGQPMLLSLQMRNDGNTPAGYRHTLVTVNDPMLVTGPDGETVPYVDTSYQTMVYPDAVLPGEVVALADKYDVTSQYRIIRPGRYRFQFRGTHHGGKPSNVLEVNVKPGPLPAIEQVVERLLPVLPPGWKFTRHTVSESDDIDAASFGQLYIHLIGQPGGKGGDRGVLLVVLPGSDASETDPWLKESFDFWGLSPWGLVYASVHDADPLWPDHKAEIVRVLEIKPPQGP
jgi:hypothetical protein